MSKKTITIDVFQCDYVGENKERCSTQGERQQIRECVMCKKDLCNRHYEMWNVGSQPGRVSLTYIFCHEHAEEFIDTMVKTLGDTRPVAYYGMAK